MASVPRLQVTVLVPPHWPRLGVEARHAPWTREGVSVTWTPAAVPGPSLLTVDV